MNQSEYIKELRERINELEEEVRLLKLEKEFLHEKIAVLEGEKV